MLTKQVQNDPISIRRDTSGQPTIPADYPRGKARHLNENASDNWNECLALFSEVKNTVIKANPNFYLPFNLKLGEPSPLGLFAESRFYEKPGIMQPGKHALECQHGHNRSAILGRMLFQDANGRVYRDVDLKGIGAVSDSNKELVDHKVNIRNPGAHLDTGNYEGLLSRHIALHDYKMTEEFLRRGIGTCRILGVIELQEIIATRPSKSDQPLPPRVFTVENVFELSKDPYWLPEKLSLKEAFDEGIIAKDFHPAIEVRAFSIKSRISDIVNHFGWGVMGESGLLMLNDAKKLISEELGLKKTMSSTAYLEWFSKTLGRNMGLMHRNGWEHHYLYGGHNITLDGSIVDLDGVRPLEGTKRRLDEQACVEYATLPHFCEAVTLSKERNAREIMHFTDVFRKSYEASFESGRRARSDFSSIQA